MALLRFTLCLFVLIAAPSHVLAGPTVTTPRDQGVTASTAGIETFMAILNQTRAQAGLRPLRNNARLNNAAAAHAADMRVRNYFSHRSPNGATPMRRAQRAGYRACRSGETLAKGQRNVETAFRAWMGSPGHRKVLMGRQYREFGFARSGNHWVVVTGRSC
ncbi:MAG: CAP domain-containing protein [Pseudomonadota bacterium]